MIGIGFAAGLGAYLATRSQHKTNEKLAPSIEAALGAQGALTLPALTDAIGLRGFTARGKVMLALNELVAQEWKQFGNTGAPPPAVVGGRLPSPSDRTREGAGMGEQVVDRRRGRRQEPTRR